MSEQTDSRRETACGAVLMGVGLVVGGYAVTHYRLGTPAAMGPGFFPAVLGLTLCALGAVIAGTAWRQGHPSRPLRIKTRALVMVALSILCFAATIRPLGFVPAAFLLVAISALADSANRPAAIALLAAVLTALSWLIFGVGLGMPLHAFNW